MMAGKLLVPVTRGYDVFNPQTGAGERHIELIRQPQADPVVPAVAGTMLLEQRGATLVALTG
jgi:hypothetical protein